MERRRGKGAAWKLEIQRKKHFTGMLSSMINFQVEWVVIEDPVERTSCGRTERWKIVLVQFNFSSLCSSYIDCLSEFSPAETPINILLSLMKIASDREKILPIIMLGVQLGLSEIIYQFICHWKHQIPLFPLPNWYSNTQKFNQSFFNK